jgi:flagellar biosynthesis protein FlhB
MPSRDHWKNDNKIEDPTIKKHSFATPKGMPAAKNTESQNMYFYNLLLIIYLYFSCFCASVANFYLSSFLERTHKNNTKIHDKKNKIKTIILLLFRLNINLKIYFDN